MMKTRNGTVKLTFDQFWEIEYLLKREIRELERLCEDVRSEESGQIFKQRLDSLKDAFEAVSKWGNCGGRR